MVKCPKCGSEGIKENTHFDGALFWVKKVVTVYCPVCDFANTKIFPSSLTEKQNYELRRQ